MSARILLFALVAGAALASLAAQAKAPITLKSVDVTLPESSRAAAGRPGARGRATTIVSPVIPPA